MSRGLAAGRWPSPIWRACAVRRMRPDLAHLVRTGIVVDAADGFIEFGGQGVGGGMVPVPARLDGAVAAGSGGIFSSSSRWQDVGTAGRPSA
jgi:hypothetical protein